MKKLNCLILMTSLISSTAIAETINFDDAKAGEAPAGWMTAKTGSGNAKWTIETDDSAPSKPNVLKQSATGTFPICIKAGPVFKNGFVKVKFKPVAGKEDQAGGLIFRVQDKDNYYVCRANALEDNVVLYKTVKGIRSSLDIVGRSGGYGVKEKVATNQWHTLRVEFAGPHFTVSFNGKKVFEVEDTTFTEAGKIGLWTKDDSVTLFDDFSFGSTTEYTKP